jgi:cytochrome c oxidase subunit 1
MTQTPEGPAPITASPAEPGHKGSQLGALLRTTDHKVIGSMYFATSFTMFLIGGLMALLMRAELARPGMQFLTPEQHNQLVTIHGTIMLLLFATPAVFAFANLILPLQIGSPDVAFPRLNAFPISRARAHYRANTATGPAHTINPAAPGARMRA